MRQVCYFFMISIQWCADEFEKKRVRIIVYGSVTRYGPRAPVCQRGGLNTIIAFRIQNQIM